MPCLPRRLYLPEFRASRRRQHAHTPRHTFIAAWYGRDRFLSKKILFLAARALMNRFSAREIFCDFLARKAFRLFDDAVRMASLPWQIFSVKLSSLFSIQRCTSPDSARLARKFPPTLWTSILANRLFSYMILYDTVYQIYLLQIDFTSLTLSRVKPWSSILAEPNDVGDWNLCRHCLNTELVIRFFRQSQLMFN